MAPAAVLSSKLFSNGSPLIRDPLCGIPVAPSMNPAIDSNALTYLVEAMTPGYAPSLDKSALAAERVAMIRTYLYTDVLFWVGPEVEKEYERIRDQNRHLLHFQTVAVLLAEGGVDSSFAIDARARELEAFHSGVSDCRVVAESEARGCAILLTCDDALATRLASRAKLQILRPTAFWLQLDVSPGTPIKRTPSRSNPLSGVDWWRW